MPNRCLGNSKRRLPRWKHPREYLDRAGAGEPVQQENTVTVADLPFEFMMNALRLIRGFPAWLFEERTGLPLLTVKRELEEAERRGLVSRTHKDIAPTLRPSKKYLDSYKSVVLL